MSISDTSGCSLRAARIGNRTSSSDPDCRGSRVRRFFGVVIEPQTYRNLAYAFLGLPLGLTWFTTLATGAAIGISMLTVALVGIPILLGMWHVVHCFACAERSIANRLLDTKLPHCPTAPASGNLWQRLRAMTADQQRRRELGFLLARLPIGIATFALATTLLVTSGAIAYAPIHARMSDEPFGNWSMSARFHEIASSEPWAWVLTSAGTLGLIASLHTINRFTRVTARSALGMLGRTTDR